MHANNTHDHPDDPQLRGALDIARQALDEIANRDAWPSNPGAVGAMRQRAQRALDQIAALGGDE